MKKRFFFGILISFVLGVAITYSTTKYYLKIQSDAAYAYGLSLLDNNEKDKAIAAFNQAIGIYIKNYKPYISLGKIYERNEMKNLSIEYYKKALELCPSNSSLQKTDKKYIEERLRSLSN